MNRGFVSAASAAIVTSLVASAGALPVSYSESVSGDLSQFGTPLTTFTLDLGVNVIAGTIGFNAGPSNTDRDSYAVVIPPGMMITNSNLSLVLTQGDFGTANWDIYLGSANYHGGIYRDTLYAFTPTVEPFPVLPLYEGLFNISTSTMSGSFTTGGHAGYTFTYNVDLIPEPVSLSLLSTGALLLLRRRR